MAESERGITSTDVMLGRIICGGGEKQLKEASQPISRMIYTSQMAQKIWTLVYLAGARAKSLIGATRTPPARSLSYQIGARGFICVCPARDT